MNRRAYQREAVRTATNCDFLSFVRQIMTLLSDANRCYFFWSASCDITGRQRSPEQKLLLWFFFLLCCKVKIQKFIISEEHLKHLISFSPTAPKFASLEPDKWLVGFPTNSPDDRLNIYIGSLLTATMISKCAISPKKNSLLFTLREKEQ